MAALGGEMLGLVDLAKRTDPNGMIDDMAELLNESAPMIEDIPWVESNLPTGHRYTVRTKLPTTYKRAINAGVRSSKSQASQVTDSMTIFESWSTVDRLLVDMAPDSTKFRDQENAAFVESMGQAVQENFIYGNVADDVAEFTGLMSRYDSLTGDTSDNVLNAYAAVGSEPTTNTKSSVWLVYWSPQTLFVSYPRGTAAGLSHYDAGLQPVHDPTGDGFGAERMLAYQDQFCWNCGLALRDWRYVVRICNIEAASILGVKDAQATTQYGSALVYLMMEAMDKIPNPNMGRACFYLPRDVFTGFNKFALASQNANILVSTDVDGKPVNTFRGIPMKVVDQLTYSEAYLS